MTDSVAIKSKSFWQPSYWPLLFGLGLIWCAAHLPYRWQMRLGRLSGRLLFSIARQRRHIAKINLGLCFPELSVGAQRVLLRRHFESLGVGLFETALGWWGKDSALRSLAHIEGLDYLHQALKKGKGVILLSAHFTTLEIGGRLLSLHAPFYVLYREHRNPVFEAIMRHSREAHYDKAIQRNDIRTLVRSLKDNMAVWYAADQNYRGEHTEFVPFFNIPAATNTAISRLARMSGAAVIPFFQQRLADCRGYRLVILPALEKFPSDSPKHDAERINRIIEDQIQRMPEQYLWAHRRFKDRPPGEDDVYRL